jgi:hypothetical protein
LRRRDLGKTDYCALRPSFSPARNAKRNDRNGDSNANASNPLMEDACLRGKTIAVYVG